MSNQEVPKVSTPVSEAELTRALIDGARELFNIELTKPQVAILVAQNNLETGSRKSLFNWNLGNITHTNADNFDYYVGGDKTRDKNGNWIPTKYKFRSYPTLKDAVKDFLFNIKNRGQGKVWETVLQADPIAFSKALKKTNYYEADEKDYSRGMLAHVNEFNKKDSFQNAVSGNFTPSTVAVSTPPKPSLLSTIETLLNNFLKAVAKMQQTPLRK